MRFIITQSEILGDSFVTELQLAVALFCGFFRLPFSLLPTFGRRRDYCILIYVFILDCVSKVIVG